MERKCPVWVVLISFLVVFCPFPARAAGPDGFANVPWGASKAQLEQTMAQQGARSLGQVQGRSFGDGSTGYRYQGSLVGTAGILEFWFMNGVFIRGSFDLHNEDGGAAESKAYWQFFPIIQSKYGSPTKSASNTHPYTGVSNVWDGLQAPGSADKVQILLFYTATNERCGRGLCTSSFGVVYTNQTLQQRMASQTKDGL